jgi:hypothetical protein
MKFKNSEKVYRYSIVHTAAIYVAVLILPFNWPLIYSNEVIEKIVWSNGAGAIVYIPIALFYTISALYMISLIGLIFYKRWAKYVFISLTGFVLIANLGQGVFSQGPLESFGNQALSLIDGFIVALIFYSPISERFD